MKKLIIGLIILILLLPFIFCFNDFNTINELEEKQEKLDTELNKTINVIEANDNIISGHIHSESYKNRLKLENIELEKKLNQIEFNSDENRKKITSLDYKVDKKIKNGYIIIGIILITSIIIFIIIIIYSKKEEIRFWILNIENRFKKDYSNQKKDIYQRQFESKKEEEPKETKDTIFNKNNNVESNLKQEPKIDIVWTSPTTYQQKPKEEEQQKESTYKSKSLLSNFEKEFYKKLIIAVNNRAYIQTQINLASIIDKKEGYYKNELFRNIDFGLFDKETLKIIVLIELNDSSHKNSNRYQRDLKVREILKDANIPLITLYSSYENNIDYIKRRINEFLH